jgi:hypothetical protein
MTARRASAPDRRAVRGASRPHVGGRQTRSLVGLARGTAGGAARLKALLTPYPAEEMTCWRVSARVGSVRNNDASLIEPIAVNEPA